MRICDPRRAGGAAGRPAQAGFTFLALLFMLALLGVGMAALGSLWGTVAKRDREAQLLQTGREFERALASYHRASPGTEKRYPARLEDLLLDNRFPNTVRHLRRVYRDPISGQAEWGLTRDAAGGIVGIYSLSEAEPMKQAGFGPGREHFEEARSYLQWVFKAAEVSSAGAVAAKPAAAPRVAGRREDCLEAGARGRQACQMLRQAGDVAGWRECMAAVLAELRQCSGQ